MSRSTGPILAAGGLSLANMVIVHNEASAEKMTRIVVGAGIAAASLALVERLNEQLAVSVAWLALLTVLLVRVDPNVPAPLEGLADWWNKP